MLDKMPGRVSILPAPKMTLLGMPVHSKESIAWLVGVVVDERAIDNRSKTRLARLYKSPLGNNGGQFVIGRKEKVCAAVLTKSIDYIYIYIIGRYRDLQSRETCSSI